MKRVALTFDLDWAPDSCIEECLDLCARYAVPATYFVTHETSLLQRMRNDPLIELGLHPNLLDGSSHGHDMATVLNHMSAMIPEAKSMRTHALVQSTPLFNLVADRYPTIDTDVSLLLPLQPQLLPFEMHFGESQRRLTRLPYFWEDDVFAAWPTRDWSAPPPLSDGLRIFDFHPILVGLNVDDLRRYRDLKKQLGGRSLHSATRSDLARNANPGVGVRDFLVNLIQTTPRGDFALISELTQLHRRAANESSHHRTDTRAAVHG